MRPFALRTCFSLLAIAMGVSSSIATGSELRALLEFSTPFAPTFEGTAGETIARVGATYTNISDQRLEFLGVADVQTRNPEDVGLDDLLSTVSGLDEIEAAFPTYDLFNSFAWFDEDTPPKNWLATTLEFEQPFPILLEPGESFTYTRTLRHSGGGLSFGPGTESELLADGIDGLYLADRVGESLVALDFGWRRVPEPSSLALLAGVLLVALRARRDSAK